MLNILRKKKIMKRLLWGLAIIIIPAFVFWGAGTSSRKKLPYEFIGIIEGKKIPVDTFIKSMKDTQASLLLNYFGQPQILRDLQNNQAFLNRLTWEGLIIQEKAKRQKISVDDEEVINFVTRHPLFVRGMAFDDKIYSYILRNSLGVDPRSFEESIRNLLVNAKFKDGITKGVTVPDSELREAYKNEFEKVKFYYVVVNKDNFEEEIYEKGAKRNLSLKNMLKKQKRAVRRKRRKERKETGEKEKIKEDALKLLETDFVSRPDYIEGLAESRKIVDKAFAMKKGEVSPPIETQNGFVLIEPVEFELVDEEVFEKEKENYRRKSLETKKAKFFREWFEKARQNASLYVDLDKI